MLDTKVFLMQMLDFAELDAEIQPLREPCTCAPELPECPACRAWSQENKRRRAALDGCQAASRIQTIPAPTKRLSDAEFARLERRIRYNTENLRLLRERGKRYPPLSLTDQHEEADTIQALAELRGIRDAHLRALKKGAH